MSRTPRRAPSAGLLQVGADRGPALARIAAVYHLANLLILAPFTALLGSAALAARGTPAVVNDALVGLFTSPFTLATLALSALASLTISRLSSGASSFVVVDGRHGAIGSIGQALRNLGGLLGIVGWALWWGAGLSLPFVAVALGAYVARFGLRSPVAAFARDPNALGWIGVGLAVALAILWTWLFLRWALATPAYCATPAMNSRDALRRSQQLTRGRRLRLLGELVVVQIPIVLLFTLAAAIVRGIGGWAVGATDAATWTVGATLAATAAVQFGSNVLSSAAYESVTTSRFLALDGRPLMPAALKLQRPGALVVAGAVVVAFIGVLGAAEAAHMMRAPVNLADIEVIAHRGASTGAPENSLSAVALARSQGADRIELDVQRTKDGALVVIHDSDTLRLTGVDLSVKDSTLKQLKKLDIGKATGARFARERIPTLEEYMAAAGPTPLALEIKSKGADGVATIQGVIEELNLDSAVGRTVLISLDADQLDVAKGIDPALAVGQLVAVTEGDPALLPVQVVAPESGIAPSPFVFAAHASGKKVWVWTLDDEQLVQEAALRGVDGIITNDVPKAKAALAKMGTVTAAQVARQRLADLLQ